MNCLRIYDCIFGVVLKIIGKKKIIIMFVRSAVGRHHVCVIIRYFACVYCNQYTESLTLNLITNNTVLQLLFERGEQNTSSKAFSTASLKPNERTSTTNQI